MHDELQVLVEMNELVWSRLKRSLADMTPEEADWRPLPQANSINLILRHLRIDAAWHAASMEAAEPTLPQGAFSHSTPESFPLDFASNLKELEVLYGRFVAALRPRSLADLQQQTKIAYRDTPADRTVPAHLLGYHMALHLIGHGGQISTIRNLYCKTRGQPARFFPENPTFPA